MVDHRAWLEAECERTLARLVDAEERGLDGLSIRIRTRAFEHASLQLEMYLNPSLSVADQHPNESGALHA